MFEYVQRLFFLKLGFHFQFSRYYLFVTAVVQHLQWIQHQVFAIIVWCCLPLLFDVVCYYIDHHIIGEYSGILDGFISFIFGIFWCSWRDHLSEINVDLSEDAVEDILIKVTIVLHPVEK